MHFGVVGNNLYGKMFTRGINSVSNCHVVAICPDINEELEPMASEFFLKEYEDLQSMLNSEQLDGVLLASVTSHHAQQILTSLSHGVHVVVDRPMAFSTSECNQVIKRSEETGKLVFVAQVLNFWPEYVKIRELIGQSALGIITNVTTSRVSGLIDESWSKRLLSPKWGFGGLEALIHDIDFLNGMWGSPTVVAAHGTHSPDKGFQQVHALLEYAGITAGIEADYGVPYNYPLRMSFRAVGTEGALEYRFSGALAKQGSATRSLTFFRKGSDPELIELPTYDAFKSQASNLVECIKNNITASWGNMYEAKTNLKTLQDITELWRAQV
jgi:predicted dehydrogenase